MSASAYCPGRLPVAHQVYAVILRADLAICSGVSPLSAEPPMPIGIELRADCATNSGADTAARAASDGFAAGLSGNQVAGCRAERAASCTANDACRGGAEAGVHQKGFHRRPEKGAAGETEPDRQERVWVKRAPVTLTR
jgi:hypothetical protein